MSETTIDQKDLIVNLESLESAVADPDEDLTAEDLIEEVSIDGMCGVY